MEFSEAFDKISHSGLLFKLSELGASEEVCQWAKSFLVSRTLRVVVDGVASECEPVTSGVPQGLVLGPIFFLVYINDMAKCINHSSVRLFADDTIIYKAVKSVSDCEFLQEDLDALESWAKEWTMEFHPDKCSIMRVSRKKNELLYHYKLKDQPLATTSNSKYLGVHISNKMDWSHHIGKTVKKANQKLGFVKRNLKNVNQDIKCKAYKSLVRPTLEYACTVWDPYYLTSTDNLEAVQRRAARWVMNNYDRECSVTCMLKKLDWRVLAQRRADARIKLLSKILKEKVDIEASKYVKHQRNNIDLQLL